MPPSDSPNTPVAGHAEPSEPGHPEKREGPASSSSTRLSRLATRHFFHLLPHEYVFQLFLLTTWLRLVHASGFTGFFSLLYLSFLLTAAFLIYLSPRVNHEWAWRLRLLYYPIVMNFSYKFMAPVVAIIHHGPLLDSDLQRIDHALIGENLSLRLEPHIRPLFTEPLSFCYMLFIPYLTFSMLEYLLAPLPLLKRFYLGLFTIYGIGFLGYTFVPAAGPYLVVAHEFRVPLTGYVFTHWNATMVRYGSNGVDVFPSLHCAISSYMLFFDRWYKKWRFRLYAVPCVGLWFSTIYLRYHYFIDVIVGFALSASVLYLTRRWELSDA